jgi:hypothetical protein
MAYADRPIARFRVYDAKQSKIEIYLVEGIKTNLLLCDKSFIYKVITIYEYPITG